MLTTLETSSSVLAFVTTIHLAMVVLRAHRTPSSGFFSFVSLISILFTATPWLLPTPVGIAAGLTIHVVWWIACERLLPAPQPTAAPATPPVAKTPVPVATVLTTPAPKPPARPAAAGAPAAPRKPHEFVQTPILSVVEETPTIRTFRIARPDGFDFIAGQFLAVRVRAEGKDHVRCYSVSSAPEMSGYLEISVRRLGLVSGTLHATLRPGSMLAVKAPAGAFRYPAGEDRPLVFIAGGVGITPLMSMLRHAVAADPMRPMTLFYSVRTVEEIAFRDELQFLQRRNPQFRAFVAVTEGPAGNGFYPGQINDSLLRTTVPDIAHMTCLVCGPRPMLDAMTTMLMSLGVQRPQIHFEIFQAAVAAAAGSPPPAEEAPAPKPAGVAHANGSHQLRFTVSSLTIRAVADQTLLEAAEACGAQIPSLCRAGVCGTCRTRVLEGTVDCPSRTLDDQDRQDGFVLPCVSHAKSDCTVEA